jgi:CheY-like chemotaxis protein
MSQVFNNLLINAKQAMPEGGTVMISAENLEIFTDDTVAVDPGRYVRIAVKDQGGGIAPENLSKIFDPYFSTKPHGSGLGLASVYSIVKRHGGIVSAASEPEKGSTLTILIPAAREKTKAFQEDEQRTASLRGEGTVLVMDDEEIIREIASAILTEYGYSAETCKDGFEAVELHAASRDRGEHYAAIILDLTVPGGMGGKEAARLIRSIDEDVPLIVSSGYSDDTVVAGYLQHGFTGAVVKPYTLKDMAAELSRVVAIRRIT